MTDHYQSQRDEHDARVAALKQKELEDLHEELTALQHALQTGVAYDQVQRPESTKHLRVGVNSALVFNGALGKLLCDKGIITEAEYLRAMIEGMKREVKRYEDLLTRDTPHGTAISLL